MIRGVLILCAGLLGFAAEAQGGCDIAAKVAELSPGFSPVKYGDCGPGAPCNFRPPQDFIAKRPSPTHQTDTALVVAAYDAAPPFFQDALCRLDHIYIDTDTKDPAKPSVWGMRQRLDIDSATKLPRTHIGIAEAVMTDLEKHRTPYAAYENLLTRALLAPAAPSPTTPVAQAVPLTYAAALDPSKKEPTAITLLGILAHEMGHIVWWERDVGASDFPAISWTTKSVQHGFHEFGVADPENPPQRRPVKADVQYDLRYLGASKAAEDLQKVYGGEWASLFATVAADEDFVETYKLVVLTQPGANQTRPALIGLKVTIPGAGGADVLATLNNPATKSGQKAKWVRDLVSGSQAK